MSVMVTGGRTRINAAKIYDRLRKRSLRALNLDRSVTFRDMTVRTTGDPWVDNGVWIDTDHMAYVAGVRDALNAVSEDA